MNNREMSDAQHIIIRLTGIKAALRSLTLWSWITGWMFTVGLNGAEYARMNLQEQLAALLLNALVWPLTLGGSLAALLQ